MTRSRTPAPHPPTTAPEPSKTPKVELPLSVSGSPYQGPGTGLPPPISTSVPGTPELRRRYASAPFDAGGSLTLQEPTTHQLSQQVDP
jgi:hypothetical protein